MKKIKSIEEALELFKIAAVDNLLGSSQGKYKKANKAYNNLEKIIIYLIENDALELLKQFYSSDNLGVKLAAACFLAPIDDKNAKEVILDIMNLDIASYSFQAELALGNWENLSGPDRYDDLHKK